MKSLPIKTYLNLKLRFVKLTISAIIAIVSSVFVATLLFFQFQDLSKEYVKSITPHLATLIETGDYVELQRFIELSSASYQAKMRILNNGEIIASTVNNTEIGRNLSFSEEISLTKIHILESVNRPNGPVLNSQIYFERPATQIQMTLIITMITVFILMFISMSVLMDYFTRTVNKSLHPLEEIATSLKALGSDNIELKDQKIAELKMIVEALKTGHQNMLEARDRMAESKAKDYLLKTYKCLIHDLQNPVSTLKSTTNHLKGRDIDPQDFDKALNLIVRTSGQILSLLEAAKEHMGVNLKLVTTDLRKCVTEVLEQVRLATGNNEINYQLLMPESELLKPIDESQLSRALSNIITNSIESSKGKVQIKLEDIDNEITIKVSDNGSGADSSEIGLFLQGRGKTKKENHFGLGLYSANQIIKSHGGKIIYSQSADLGGAEFTVCL